MSITTGGALHVTGRGPQQPVSKRIPIVIRRTKGFISLVSTSLCRLPGTFKFSATLNSRTAPFLLAHCSAEIDFLTLDY
jgi:hypothetical protein